MGSAEPIRDPRLDETLRAMRDEGMRAGASPMPGVDFSRWIPSGQWWVDIVNPEGAERMPVEVATYLYLRQISGQLAALIDGFGFEYPPPDATMEKADGDTTP